MVSRDPERGRRTLDEMRTAIGHGAVELEVADLERQSEVRALAARDPAAAARLWSLIETLTMHQSTLRGGAQ